MKGSEKEIIEILYGLSYTDTSLKIIQAFELPGISYSEKLILRVCFAYRMYIEKNYDKYNAIIANALDKSICIEDKPSIMLAYALIASVSLMNHDVEQLNYTKDSIQMLLDARPYLFEPTTAVEKAIIYHYYYALGLAYSEDSQIYNGLKHLKLAKEYCRPENHMFIYTNIAFLHMDNGSYKNAIMHHRKALLAASNKEQTAIANNNMAYMVRETDKESATKFINRAIDNITPRTPMNRIVNFYDTYLDIVGCKDSKKILQLLKNLESIGEDNFICIKFIDSVINHCKSSKDDVLLNQVFEIISDLMRRERNVKIADELKIRYCNILILKT